LRVGLRRARAVTGCSQFTLDDAIGRFGLPPARGLVVFNGVDTQETAPVPVSLPVPRYVLGLGRVVHKKGFDLLIDAFRDVADRVPDVGLVISGTGPQAAALDAQVKINRLESRVHFTGKLGRGEVAWIMQHAEVFVMPSRVEPFGIVTLEAWAAGTPVVVSSHGGAAEFVEHDVTGIVVDPQDRSALARSIEQLLKEPDRRARFVAAGSDQLPNYSWEKISSQYRQLYRSVLLGA